MLSYSKYSPLFLSVVGIESATSKKHFKKVEGHIDRNVVIIPIKMRSLAVFCLWFPRGGYPFLYYCVGHDGKDDRVLGTSGKGGFIYTAWLYKWFYCIHLLISQLI